MIYEKLKTKVTEWRKKGYPCKYPEISEIFVYIKEKGYLRKAQVEALEHYWYVRTVLKTPKIKELYQTFLDTLLKLPLTLSHPLSLKLLP